jgi:hypothetical protein
MSIIYHPVGENTRMRFLLLTSIGTGLTGQTPTVLIKRRSDSEYWNNATFQGAPILLAMTEEDPVNLPGSYFYDFNQTTAGASQDEYLVNYVNSAPGFTATDQEQHIYSVFAVISTGGADITIGRAMADDGVTFTLTVWVEIGGQRQNNYNTMAAQMKDTLGNLIVDFGTTGVQTSDGLFTFQCPTAAITRNIPYIIAVQAQKGIQTTSYNLGFVRV